MVPAVGDIAFFALLHVLYRYDPAGAEALYSALFAPLLYPVVRAIHERFGLEPDY